ncbi:MAG: FecR family protein [Gemmatimonadales bacterium]
MSQLPADPTDDTDAFYRLVVRQFSGAASEQDDAALERWISADPVRRTRLLDQLHTLWLHVRVLPARRRSHAAWARISQRMVGPPRIVPLRSRSPAPGLMATALAGALAAGVVVALIARGRVSPDTRARPVVTYATGHAQRAVVRFPDGTTVTLAPDSRIEVPEAARRTVRLFGEALFDVTHDPHHPFAVQAGHAVVRDIGTRFLVEAYADEPSVRVAVSGGRVALGPVSGGMATYALGPGDAAAITANNATTIEHGVDVASRMAWSTGQLRFHAEPLPEVVRAVSRWYGVPVTLADHGLATKTLTAELATDESVSDALTSIALVSHAHVTRRGASYELTAAP